MELVHVGGQFRVGKTVDHLAMLDDVMSGSRILGIVQPAGGDSADPGVQDLRRIGCAGRVTSYQELDDGRLIITLTGLARFEIVEEVPAKLPYRLTSVRYDRFAADLQKNLGNEDVDRARLLRALRGYLERNKLAADWNVIERASNEFLINALSIMSPYGPEEKQALLEASDLKTRAEVLVTLAEMELAAQGGSGGTLQ